MSRNSHQKNQLTHFAETVWAAPAKAFGAAPALGASGHALARFLGALAAPVANLYRRHRLYEELTQLDDRLLADIGIARSDIPRVVDGAFRDVAGAPRISRRPILNRSAGAKA